MNDQPRWRLRRARVKRGWGYGQAVQHIAETAATKGIPPELLDVDESQLKRWEAGKNTPRKLSIWLLSETYRLPAEELDLPRLAVGLTPPLSSPAQRHQAGAAAVSYGHAAAPPNADGNESDVNRREFLAAIGGAVVSAASVSPQPPGSAREHLAIPEVARVLFGRTESGSETDAVTLANLDARVNTAWQLWITDPNRYTAIRPLLAQLTLDVECSVRQNRTPQEESQRRRACKIAAHHYFLLRSYFRAVGRYDLATVTADRGLHAAEATDNPILLAGAHWNAATVLLINTSELAHEIAVTAANVISPWRDKDNNAAAVCGALHLTAASAAARLGRFAVAREHVWRFAQPLAEMTGETTYLWTEFGPMNVNVIAVGVETRLGQSVDALRLAGRVEPTKLRSIERRATHLMEVARNYELRGEDAGVLHYLLRMEHDAPEDLIYQPVAVSLIRGLLARSRPTLRPDIVGLAQRAGIR